MSIITECFGAVPEDEKHSYTPKIAHFMPLEMEREMGVQAKL